MATYQITFITESKEKQLPVRDDQYLLDAANDAGLNLPFMCLQGWCTTCAGRILQGEVDQAEALRFYPQDGAAGFVLLCSAFPRSDLRILTHQKEPMRLHRQAVGLPAPGVEPMLSPSWLNALAWGPLVETGHLPESLHALLCELRPRFISKGRVGSGYRAVARNGRILLASNLPLEALAARPARVRLQLWHKKILPGDLPTPYGLLLCVRTGGQSGKEPLYQTQLTRAADFGTIAQPLLTLDVGGLMVLTFFPKPN